MLPAFDVNKFILYGKIAGAVGGIGGLLYTVLKWIVPKLPFVQKINSTSESVSLMLNNHYPHIQKSLNDQDVVLGSIKSDVRVLDTKVDGLDQRINDTKNGLHSLGDAFLRHVESVSVEIKKKE